MNPNSQNANPNTTDQTTPSQTLPPTRPTPSPSRPNKSKKKLLVIVAAIITLLAILAVVYFFLMNNTGNASATSDKFVSAIQKDDPEAAYNLTNNDFRQATNKSQVENIFNTVSPALQGKSKIIARKAETKNNKSYSAIVYSIETSNGTKYIRVVLQKDKNDWKVVNFRSSESKLEATVE